MHSFDKRRSVLEAHAKGTPIARIANEHGLKKKQVYAILGEHLSDDTAVKRGASDGGKEPPPPAPSCEGKPTKAEVEFKSRYVANFLSTWSASQYDSYCAAGRQEDLGRPPVEDAEHLAGEVWDRLCETCPDFVALLETHSHQAIAI